MKSAFERTSLSFRNAVAFQSWVHRIDRYPPVDELFTLISGWFRDNRDDAEDPHVSEIRVRLARVRGTIAFGVLQFDHPGLLIREQMAEISEIALQFPALTGLVTTLQELTSFLIEHPHNPKGQVVSDLLDELSEPGTRPTGLISPRSRLALPGWGDDVKAVLDSDDRRLQIVSTARQLLSRHYARLVLPWGGRGCPFLHEVFYGYSCPTVHTVVYASERTARPPKIELPVASRFPGTARPEPPRHDVEETREHGEPDWQRAEFWSALRSEPGSPEATDTEGKSFFVRARLILLANDTKVLLKEDSKVIEVSDLVDGEVDDEGRNRFPRRRVRDLRPGDLIVLRTGGSGDYLLNVADSLMELDGRGDLRERALDWKQALERALQDLGSQIIAGLLESRGHGAQYHRYLWVWTTNDVIRPRSEGQFYELLAILHDLGYIEEEALATAENRWTLMKQIIGYHQKAGLKIRNGLLRRLQELVRKGERIDEALSLTLPGVDAGELSVMRVAAVDPESIEVPHHRTGTVMALYDEVGP